MKALLRLGEAHRLCEAEEWVGTIYLSGRAAEAILRALLWVKTKQQDEGHDLPDLLQRIRVLIELRTGDDRAMEDAVNELAVVWRNDLRFTGVKRLTRLLKKNGRLIRIGTMEEKGDPLKANAKSVSEAAEKVVTRGEPYVKTCNNQTATPLKERLAAVFGTA